jgi:hypothetical protein
MRRLLQFRFNLLLVGVLVVSALSFSAVGKVASQNGPFGGEECRQAVYSTEEDFMSVAGERYDGNPYVSDGDALSIDGVICARNAELVEQFDVREDMGLDALDALIPDEFVIAFSTELDSPHGNFTAGDLLFTPGFAIPNSTLVGRFGIRYDIGLDAVQFVGQEDAIREFLARAREIPYEEWNSDILIELLSAFEVDILFSTEGTFGGEIPRLLDGDVLSVLHGIVVQHEDLFTLDVPAGIPDRGVDFGLDALATPRELEREELKEVYFSTEILYDGERSFTDGDVLMRESGIAIPHGDLIGKLEDSLADFLGLDALWLSLGGPTIVDRPRIQYLCGFGKVASEFDANGLYPRPIDGTNLPSPCGDFVPIDGYIPPSGVSRFRVAYRPAGTLRPAPGMAPGIQHDWWVSEPVAASPAGTCDVTGMLGTASGGWMDATQWYNARLGLGAFSSCPSPNLRLAAWDTLNKLAKGYNPPDPNGHYVIWLEWEPSGGGALVAEPEEYHIQLDNVAPQFPSNLDATLTHEDDFEIRLPDGSSTFGRCGNIGPGQSRLQIWTSVVDEHFWRFSLRLRGPATVAYGPHAYYHPQMPGLESVPYNPIAFQNITATGTSAPPLGDTLTHVRDIDLAADLGPNFVSCAYVVDLYMWDRTIKYRYSNKPGETERRILELHDYSDNYDSSRYVTFCAVVE